MLPEAFLVPSGKRFFANKTAQQQAGVCVETRTLAYVFRVEFVNGKLKLKFKVTHDSADFSMLGESSQGVEPW